MALFHLVLCYDSGVKSGTVMSGDSPPSTPLPNFSKFSSHLLFTSWRVKDWRLYNGRINQLVSSTTSTSRELSNDVLLIKKKMSWHLLFIGFSISTRPTLEIHFRILRFKIIFKFSRPKYPKWHLQNRRCFFLEN